MPLSSAAFAKPHPPPLSSSARVGPAVLQRARRGTVLAEASVFSDQYHGDAVAAMATEVVLVAIGEIQRLLNEDHAFALEWSRHLSNELQHTRARAEILALRTVPARLDAWLTWSDGDLPERVSGENLRKRSQFLRKHCTARFHVAVINIGDATSGAGRRQRLNGRRFDMAAVTEFKARPARAGIASVVRERQVGRPGGDRFDMPQRWRPSSSPFLWSRKTSVRVPWIIAWNASAWKKKAPQREPCHVIGFSV